jgi:glyceraldehyde 3-phosphate dehydrogenase
MEDKVATRIAINGFGRIGRMVFRIGWDNPQLEFVTINDITTPKTLAYLLKYDSVHGIWNHEIEYSDNSIIVDSREIPVFAERNPALLPWKKFDVDIVVESTGLFRQRMKAALHLDAGAKKVLISAPAIDPDGTFVIGVNEKDYDPEKHTIISIGSCTTNGLAPVTKILWDNFGIEKAFMTTIHAYTNDQKILDLPHKDLRRARAAGMSIIPTTTGAAKAISLVIPELKGRFDGMAIRVPTPDGSVIDLVANLSKEVTVDEINDVFKKASRNSMKGIIQYIEDPIVSIDIVGNSHSSIFDSLATMVMGKKSNMIKILTWYDNEYGFSNRMIDMLQIMM